ncbi:hypothetical protein LTR62_003766 [Meristemomyces frigidus]|uniref:Ketoreductase domain-containing protein n=1 Tax=Meristemomyces frigidus TaxID=1508187 RepID=A0AAN7TH27_9PEZI|nr:hypothetical protein LTR62_003766 [Meristemomyces frigidus]
MEGKVIAITGAASGIGLSLAKILAKRKAKLSLSDQSEEALQKAQSELEAAGALKETILIQQCDVRDMKQVTSWIEKTIKQFGKLDGAANMAGVSGQNYGFRPLAEQQDEDEWNFVIDVNLTGVMHCLKAELRVVSDGGSIVNAASAAGVRGSPNAAAYNTSKHGVIGLTRSVAKEVGHRAIRINAIAPGVIDTPMVRGVKKEVHEYMMAAAKSSALQRAADADEVSNYIVWLLSDESSYVTASVQMVDAGLTA